MGAAPALLTIWVRVSLKEPENWEAARTAASQDVSKKMGVFSDLFRHGLLRNTLVGIGLATVGLTTFWGSHIYGKNLMLRDVKAEYLATLSDDASKEEQAALLEERNDSLKRWQTTQVTPSLEVGLRSMFVMNSGSPRFMPTGV